MKKHLSLNIEAKVYWEVKRTFPPGQISTLVNDILKEYLKKKKQQELKVAYQRTAQSKAVKAEDKIWEGSIEDGIDE